MYKAICFGLRNHWLWNDFNTARMQEKKHVYRFCEHKNKKTSTAIVLTAYEWQNRKLPSRLTLLWSDEIVVTIQAYAASSIDEL